MRRFNISMVTRIYIIKYNLPTILQYCISRGRGGMFNHRLTKYPQYCRPLKPYSKRSFRDMRLPRYLHTCLATADLAMNAKWMLLSGGQPRCHASFSGAQLTLSRVCSRPVVPSVPDGILKGDALEVHPCRLFLHQIFINGTRPSRYKKKKKIARDETHRNK